MEPLEIEKRRATTQAPAVTASANVAAAIRSSRSIARKRLRRSASFVKASLGTRCYNVVIAEEPQVGDQQHREERRIGQTAATAPSPVASGRSTA